MIETKRYTTKKIILLPPEKGVTHYTSQGKACEKEYEKTVRTPFFFFGR
jgi:hypothetical protein